MARLRRLVVAGQAHCVVQPALAGRPVFVDAVDRKNYIAALCAAAAAESCHVHAWALLDHEVRLVVRPQTAPALARLLQAVGRSYVSAYHRRHGTHGTLWSGRFRSAVLEPGAAVLDAMRWVDGATRATDAAWSTEREATNEGAVATDAGRGTHPPRHTSAGLRSSGAKANGVIDPPEIWALGNTPFEREAAYAALLAAGLPQSREAWLRKAVMGGWVAGNAPFAAGLGAVLDRPALPRQAGRPRRLRDS
jgi:putative transposase